MDPIPDEEPTCTTRRPTPASPSVVGGKCYDVHPANQGRVCQGCQANAALNQGTAIACENAQGGKRIRNYWIPVKGARDVYVHGYATLGASPLPVVP